LIMEPQRRLLLSMGAIEHASHFGWENSARKTLDVYDLILGKYMKNSRYHLLKNN
jgi:D-inositol-3-phosphate glycosyltransferase